MSRYQTPFERIPREIVYSARAIASNDTVHKNRDGRQGKLQSAIARLKQHLQEDEVVIVIRANDLQRAVNPYGYGPKKSTPSQNPASEILQSMEETTSSHKEAIEQILGGRHSVTDKYARHRFSSSDPLTSSQKLLDSLLSGGDNNVSRDS